MAVGFEQRDKVKRERERQKLIKEGEREERREGKRDHSPSSSIDPAGVSWGCPQMWAWLEYLL